MKKLLHRTGLVIFVSSLLPLAIASVEAAHHRKGDRFDIGARKPPAAAPTYAQAHHCDWVGPGARAVYRCNLDVTPPWFVTQVYVPHRVCDWVGPGARAAYVCRYY
jgi:hypothetical protein